MNGEQNAVPLCIPNNFQWKESESLLVPKQDAKRSELNICEEGLKILRSIKGPLCVVCIVGPARTGKSYLLSQLQGSKFRLGHTMKAETMGIWIGRTPIKYRMSSGEIVTVVFLDSEGIGSADSVDATDSTDNQIFTLSVLISSLLIYNSKNVPTNSDLEKLHYVSKLSDSIRVKKHGENTIEDVEMFRKCSPEFFWLIRDVTLKITDINHQPCDINTYLEQKILKEERTLSTTTERKNEIRRNIKSFFKSVDAFTLPVPSDKERVLSQMDKPEFREYLNEEFLDKMETVKQLIEEKYHPKRGLNDSVITGSQLADMIKSYVIALNTKGFVPDWQSFWDVTVKIAYQRAGETAFAIYTSAMSELKSYFPCEDEKIMMQHEEIMKYAIAQFRDETLMDPDVEQFQSHLKEFTKRCSSFSDAGECNGGFLHSLLKENWNISTTFCEDILKELVEQHLEPVLENINHETSYEYVMCVVGEVESHYWELGGALGPAAGEVYNKHLLSLEDRKKQMMRTICQLKDYHDEMENQKIQTALYEAVCLESEEENARLLRQKEARAKQHAEEIKAIQEANQRKIDQIRQENNEAIERQHAALRNQHSADMEGLRNEHRRMEKQRNEAIEKLRREQTGLNQQLAAANRQVQDLRNRPAQVVVQKKRGCSLM
ncbi:guanylate-binding protein 2-like isoform X2 [Dendronephthya gigantea]|nr:guanylate-binding protein 2-like isoform X2 [Dendronephthya gigantea]XP_028400254.1 guanylate-binding protein 2-like isoform X2 [Dendronephthya gigantea]